MVAYDKNITILYEMKKLQETVMNATQNTHKNPSPLEFYSIEDI